MESTQDPALEKLKQGIRRFQTEVYPEHSGEYQVAATTPQKPHTLMITCSDSRIDVETITGSKPGEIFVTRNVGNMVTADGDGGGVAAVVEYAVNALHVQHAVVCGHSDCGAMKGLQGDPAKLDALPAVQGWLRNAAEAKSLAVSAAAGGEVALPTLTEQNVLLQLKYLQALPAVGAAMERGELTTSGWVYDIATGDVRVYNRKTGRFESTLEGTATA